MKTVKGLIVFNEVEYEYSAQIQDKDDDHLPEKVLDLDRADGEPMSDEESENFEDIADLALENAGLLDWCERNGWQVEDTGGGCSALIKQVGKKLLRRITKADDPSAPQTFKDPIAAGQYDANDRLIEGSLKTYPGGIDELISAGE